ncbi:MAG: hypothetical protein BWY42_01089 [Candidatus Omnitrophica bacterium ADurb.Bin277]|nr:MAG: hypothetical protein BWY42_01089 [Candidatus Omnitrophica bacterium ADurb.Bin277]
MKLSGWIFMSVSWIAIIALMIYTYVRVLTNKK